MSSLRELTGKTVVVTGADGFIGAYVSAALRAQGADVRGLKGPVGHGPNSVELRDSHAALSAIAGADLVVHLAARAGGVQFQELSAADVLDDNATMTRNVLDASAQVGVERVFLASSAVVYACDAGPDLKETDPVVSPAKEAVTAYAWSKLTDEVVGEWARAKGLEVVVGRFTNVFGSGAPFDVARSTVVHALVKKAVDANPDGALEVWGDGSTVRSFIHVRDCADAVMRILQLGDDGGTYNVSAIGPISVATLAEVIRDAVAPELKLHFDAKRGAGAPRRVLDATRLYSLGFLPSISLEDGVADVVDAYVRSK